MEEWQLPVPPADYPYAAPEYLYAPRREDLPTVPPPGPPSSPEAARSEAGQAGAALSTPPPMIWSAATSTWMPAPPPAEPPAADTPPAPATHPSSPPGALDPAARARSRPGASGLRKTRPSAAAGRRSRQKRRARREQQARERQRARQAMPRPRRWPPQPERRPDRDTLTGPQSLLILGAVALCAIVAGIFVLGYQHSANRSHASDGSLPGLPAVAATGPRLSDLLSAQAAAMQRGDEAAFLAVVDPLAPATVASYRRIFANLRALRVSGFGQDSPDGGAVVGLPHHHRVDASFCLGDVDSYCSPRTYTFDVTVERRGTAALIEAVDFVDGLDSPTPPLPWEVSDLTVRAGSGLLVAASPATAARLPAILPVIAKAAEVARRYTVLTTVPDQYIVYVGADTDRLTWFGGLPPGSAGTVSDFQDSDPAIMVVLPDAATTSPLGGDGLAATLRGALARATLYHDEFGGPYRDTFVAGMVAYASYHGYAGTDADALAAAAGFVNSGQWDGHCYVDYSAGPAALTSAAPGLGYLAIGYLASTYGFARTLAFWGDVERSSNNLNTASLGEFGTPWPTVDLACAAYVRRVVNG